MKRADGFVTVATIGLAGVLLAVGAFVATLGAVAVARHRAAAAADLAALAGAQHALEGQATACTQAARIAQAQGAELQACDLVGQDVTVTVGVRLGVLGLIGTARSRAEAGPV